MYVWPGNGTPVGMFTLPYDEVTPTYNYLSTIWTTKKNGQTVQVLTVTYTDPTKTVPSNYKVT
jgi:hypothetical protein